MTILIPVMKRKGRGVRERAGLESEPNKRPLCVLPFRRGRTRTRVTNSRRTVSPPHPCAAASRFGTQKPTYFYVCLFSIRFLGPVPPVVGPHCPRRVRLSHWLADSLSSTDMPMTARPHIPARRLPPPKLPCEKLQTSKKTIRGN